MNLKRIFGTVLTVLGIFGLIYDAMLYVNTPSGTSNIKALVIYTILSLIFFIAGINLILSTKERV